MTPFDPHHLEPPVSLNRVIVADIPGVNLDPDVRGKNGYQLVSSMALATLIRESAAALSLDPALDDDRLNRAFDACLIPSSDLAVNETAHTVAYPVAQSIARSIAQQIGRRLGILLLALRRGDAVNRAARPEWDESYWDYWAGIRQIWLGGGIMSGNLGPLLGEYALRVFEDAGFSDMQIRRSPYGAALPLVGMARKAPLHTHAALVFDGGHTAIKRALALFGADGVRQLMLFPAFPTQWGDASVVPENHVERAAWLLDRVVNVIGQTRDLALRHYALTPDMPVLVSLAAYQRSGQPLAAQHGAYVLWTHITDNVQSLIAERLAEGWGLRGPVTLEHDGTAAGIAHATDHKTACATAVITIGTALGIGFPPEAGGLHPISEMFEITSFS